VRRSTISVQFGRGRRPPEQAAAAVPDRPVTHHAWVVRLQPGAELTLFNGDGGEYLAELATLERKGATACILAFVGRDRELPYEITLAQALPEAAKMDWIIEKAGEMGVAAIQPLAAQRCVVRLSGERADKRQAHWRGVIVAASEQSGRNRLARLGGARQLFRLDRPERPAQADPADAARASVAAGLGAPPAAPGRHLADRLPKAATASRKRTRRSSAARLRCRLARGCCAPKLRALPP
jgi:16S rRNA U1498 N3-methylase RsmE